ncbi:hypothetical protein BgiBS90_019170, partial [Biomphalaria glabrata]
PNNITVFVNDQKLSKNGTRISVKDSTLHFRCPDEIKPCEVFIYNESALVKSDQTSIVLEGVDIKNIIYRFESKVCNSELRSIYTPCLIDDNMLELY